MATQETIDVPIRVTAENVGGIDRTRVVLEPGVNVLAGRNATNRSSFLQAIMAALGSDHASLKGDAESGSVELEFEGERYERHLERRAGDPVFEGEPFLEDPEVADLFAFLLESNEARRAVGRGDDLRELIMRPIDTEEIRHEITHLEAQRDSIEDRLETLGEFEAERPDLVDRRASIEDRIDDVQSELTAVRAEIESHDVDVEEGRNRHEALEETFADLREARSELEGIEYDLETERESKRELEDERQKLAEERAALGSDGEDSLDQVEGRIRELRERKRSLESTLNELQNVIRFNEQRLEEGGLGLEESPGVDNRTGDGERGDVTDRLVGSGSETVCWTCGSEVDSERIEATLDRLTSLHRDTLEERNEVDDEIDSLGDRQRQLREREHRRERIDRRIDHVEADLESLDARIDSLEADREATTDRVEALEAETESFDDTDFSALLDRHREANELELELEQLRDDLEDVRDRIQEVDEELENRDALVERRETIAEDLTECRTRVERVETQAVEAFNEHMDSILSILAYENIDRIWIERRDAVASDDRDQLDRSAFDLHVVRSTDDDRAYEDTVDHLSESEREVTGLVFALAGYLVHDVYEAVPFVLLDSLEALDSGRIADLVDYFGQYADCLVVALLPEDANALPSEYNYVTDV